MPSRRCLLSSTPESTTRLIAQDPEGPLIQLYYYMEQLGWDGKPRPKMLRGQVSGEWPETLEPLSDTYMDQVYQGPLG
ncbi:MAG: hypothetical protein V3W37_11265 [Candidatus Binatia bacterium]